MKRLSPFLVILAAVAAAVALLRSDGKEKEEDRPEQWKPVRPA